MALTVSLTNPSNGVIMYTYDNLDHDDTAPQAIRIAGDRPVTGFMHATGTFGSGSVKIQGSNDGTAWVTLDDVYGDTIGVSAATGHAEFSTSAVYIRPLLSGGSAGDVDVFIAIRGV
jgi:hypothetical protein